MSRRINDTSIIPRSQWQLLNWTVYDKRHIRFNYSSTHGLLSGTIAVNFALYFITEIITAAKLVYTPTELNITFWGKGELYVLS